MKVVGHQRQCKAGGPALDQVGAEPLGEVVLVAVIAKDIASLDAPHDDMVKCSRCV
jgi:hypothetical protein